VCLSVAAVTEWLAAAAHTWQLIHVHQRMQSMHICVDMLVMANMHIPDAV
jgi:hypothetical protein